jgi:hypothetical protein
MYNNININYCQLYIKYVIFKNYLIFILFLEKSKIIYYYMNSYKLKGPVNTLFTLKNKNIREASYDY